MMDIKKIVVFANMVLSAAILASVPIEPAKASAGRTCTVPDNFSNQWYFRVRFTVSCHNGISPASGGRDILHTYRFGNIGVDAEGRVGPRSIIFNTGPRTKGCNFVALEFVEDADGGYWPMSATCPNGDGDVFVSALKFRSENRYGNLVIDRSVLEFDDVQQSLKSLTLLN